MKNKTNTIKTILFAGLIAAMILPFSVMDVSAAPNENANENATDKTQKVVIPDKLKAKKYYLQDQAAEALQNMTEAERSAFFTKMARYLDNRTVEQIELDQEIEKLSSITLQEKANGTFDKNTPSERSQKQFDKIMDLPMLKLGKTMEKAEAKIKSDKAEAKKLGLEYNENTPYPAEMFGIDMGKTGNQAGPFRNSVTTNTAFGDSVVLGHEVRVRIPLTTWYGLNVDTWIILNNDNVTTAPHYLLVDGVSTRTDNNGGTFQFYNFVCLVDKGDMSSYVEYDMYSGKIIENVFGSTIYSDTDYDSNKKLYWYHEGYCTQQGDTQQYSNPTTILGYHAYNTGGLLNVDVN